MKPKLTRQARFWQAIMSERVIYGGEVLTRLEVLKQMRQENQSEKCIDYFVFGTKAL